MGATEDAASRRPARPGGTRLIVKRALRRCRRRPRSRLRRYLVLLRADDTAVERTHRIASQTRRSNAAGIHCRPRLPERHRQQAAALRAHEQMRADEACQLANPVDRLPEGLRGLVHPVDGNLVRADAGEHLDLLGSATALDYACSRLMLRVRSCEKLAPWRCSRSTTSVDASAESSLSTSCR